MNFIRRIVVTSIGIYFVAEKVDMGPDNLLKNENGLTPVIGVLLMLVIVFLMGTVIAISLLGSEQEDKLASAPLALLSVSEYNNTTLKIGHKGGDVIEFNYSTTSVILNVEGTDYLLNSSPLESLGAGNEKLLLLKDREGNLIPIKAGDVTIFKVIDLKTQKLIFTQEMTFTKSSEPATKYQSGITGYYYRGTNFSGTAINRTDSRIKFAENASARFYGSDIENWPYNILNTTDSFSVAYEGLIKIEQTSNYTFYLTSDDWAQLYIDGAKVISEPSSSTRHPRTINTATISLPEGYHQIRVEMKEYAGTSILHLEWASESFSRRFVENFYREYSST